MSLGIGRYRSSSIASSPRFRPETSGRFRSDARDGWRGTRSLTVKRPGASAISRRRARGSGALGGLRPGEPLEIDTSVPREALVRDRPELPPGAIVFESGPVDAAESVPIASVRLEGTELRVEAMSEERLDFATGVIAGDFGDLTELTEREVVPIEQRLDEHDSGGPPRTLPPGLTPNDERRLVGATS